MVVLPKMDSARLMLPAAPVVNEIALVPLIALLTLIAPAPVVDKVSVFAELIEPLMFIATPVLVKATVMSSPVMPFNETVEVELSDKKMSPVPVLAVMAVAFVLNELPPLPRLPPFVVRFKR